MKKILSFILIILFILFFYPKKIVDLELHKSLNSSVFYYYECKGYYVSIEDSPKIGYCFGVVNNVMGRSEPINSY